jgi:pyridoxine kinase
MNLLSIQSHVAYGHVGNSAAVFPLQRLGVEVWPLHTVQFSNHPGYGAWRGRVLEADAIREVVQGIEERGVLGECDGVLSGYLGSVEIGQAVLDAVARVKAANPTAHYCCDPVIGDVEPGVFVCEGVPEFIRDCAVPVADILTPNQFELAHLTGRNSTALAGVLAAVDRVHGMGPRVVLVTSLRSDETPAEAVDLLASGGDARYRVRTPRLPVAFNGAGDAIAGLFLAHFLREGSISLALALAASSIYGLVCRTAEAGSRELLLVEAQDEFVAPRQEFRAERL